MTKGAKERRRRDRGRKERERKSKGERAREKERDREHDRERERKRKRERDRDRGKPRGSRGLHRETTATTSAMIVDHCLRKAKRARMKYEYVQDILPDVDTKYKREEKSKSEER